MDIVLRAVAIYVFLFLLMRAIGRRELSQLQPFDVLLLVVLGDLITQGALQSDMSVTGAMLAAGTFALMTVATSFVAYRFRPMRRVLEGQPLVIVMDGKVIEANLARERLTIEDVQEEARGHGVASLSDVRWAVLETTGRISFITR